MGKTYSVPRNVKGETRLLYIFSIKSMITTVAVAMFGVPIFMVMNKAGHTLQGMGVIGIFGAVGYLLGVLKIPDTPMFGNLRKAGGEELTDILLRLVTFTKRKKIYVYKPGPDLVPPKTQNGNNGESIIESFKKMKK